MARLGEEALAAQLAVAEVLGGIGGIAQREAPAEVQQQPLAQRVGLVDPGQIGAHLREDWGPQLSVAIPRGSASRSLPVITPADAARPAFTKSRRVHFAISKILQALAPLAALLWP